MNRNMDGHICPFCGTTLQKGVLYTPTGPGLFFFKKKPFGVSWLPLQLLKIKSNEDAIVLAGPFKRKFTETNLPSYCCMQCKYIIHYYTGV